ncbi:hypothetical protein GYMLUDRAFT_54580 [Collybiopsis luxurians FD-317 M1]|nr:hypothetical protein GYMLUDRAFT_54580 [Collybiopsis luxurians FD-317 M1]
MLDHDDSERLDRRKGNSENKFYRFLTRSRSHSSRRTAESEQHGQDHDQPIHSRNSSWSSARSSEKRPKSTSTATSSKPSTIIPSRPISSTTTATNTTVTPPTPKARRQLPSSIPKPIESPPVPKSPTTTRKRLHNIFGRKSSISSSRGTSPGPEEAPPLPTLVDDKHEQGDSTPRPKKQYSRPTSPTQRFPRTRQSHSEPSTSTSTTTNPASHPPSKLENLFKPTKLFSGSRRAQSPPPPISLSHPNSAVSPMPTPSSTNSDSSHAHINGRSDVPIVSAPSKHASTSKIARRRASTNESISSLSSLHRTSASQPAVLTSIPVPRITHTPATPSGPGTTPVRLSQTPRKDSIESGYRYRPLVMDMVDEEIDTRELEVKGKEKEKEDLTVSRTSSKGKESDHSSASGRKSSTHHHSSRHPSIKPKTTNLSQIRSAKHGSFDFERPGWLGGANVARSLSGTAGTSRGFSYRNRSGESVGSAARHAEPSRSKKETNVKISSRREEYRKRSAEADDDPAPPYSATPATGPGAGLSSSLGRSSGKRSGIAQLVGGFVTHGAFSFEPAVPSPISPTFSRPSHDNDVSVKGEKERERRKGKERTKPQERHEKERTRDPEREAPGLPNSSSVPLRSGRKGRSLDLGIGLSWAPSKVREDALLPGGVLFASTKGLNGKPSDSTGGRTALRASRSRAVDEFGVSIEDRSKVGRNVAEEFKKALDPEGYSSFKRYVHQFDRHDIPFDGSTGIITRAQRLLDTRSDMDEESKRLLINRLVKIVLQNA